MYYYYTSMFVLIGFNEIQCLSLLLFLGGTNHSYVIDVSYIVRIHYTINVLLNQTNSINRLRKVKTEKHFLLCL